MHLFISAGEPSGDLHGANLIKALKRLDPSIRFSGFGGDKMEAAGCKLLYPLTKLAVMWFLRAILNIFTFIGLLKKAKRFFRDEKPDAVVVIDFPGFHWQLAKRAHALGIPVYYFVPPQLWAWAGWRIKKMKKWVKHVLSALPFEDKWYRDKGMPSDYIGHPYFDELDVKKLDADFINEQKKQPSRVVALLPGSRMQEVSKNLPDMLEAAALVHERHPETRFLIASFNDKQAEIAREFIARSRLPVQVHVGRTLEIIELAEVCISVSGSVSLEIMYRLKPAVIVYRVSRAGMFVKNRLLKCRFITLVNLLADKEIYPEFLTVYNPSAGVAERVLECLDNPARLEEVRYDLQKVRNEVAKPGACDRAAKFLIEELRPTGNPAIAA